MLRLSDKIAAFWMLAAVAIIPNACAASSTMPPIAPSSSLDQTDYSGGESVNSLPAINLSRPPSALVANANSLLNANRNDEAAFVLKKLLESYPDLPEAHHSLGLALAKLGDPQGAIYELERARMLNPEIPSPWLTLAGLHQSLGHIDEAIALYDAFLENPQFKKRPDLQDSRATVKILLDGLKRESSAIKAAQGQAAPLNQPPRSSLLQAQAQVANDDYVNETTRAGVMTWPQTRMPIKVFIGPVVGVDGFKTEWKQILIRSFQDWAQVSGGLIRFQFVDRKEDAYLLCYFVGQPADNNSQSGAEAGDAKMFIDKNGLASGAVTILTKSPSSVLPMTDNRIRVICLHEIGHALGLAGHTSNPQDAMFFSTSSEDEWKNLSGRDARTIQRLYLQK